MITAPADRIRHLYPTEGFGRRLDGREHKFKVRAIDAAGNVDPSPAKDKFKVVD